MREADILTDDLIDTDTYDAIEIRAVMDETTIENIKAELDARTERRVEAVMQLLSEHGFALAEDGVIARGAQMEALRQLVDATSEDDGTKAVQFMEVITSDMPRIPPAVDAIIAALRAIDAPPVTADEPPTHRAVCMESGCGASVTYSPTASGAGFIVLERSGVDVDAAFGIGPNGRPVCPRDGHGEMTLADETLPAKDAFAQVAEKLTAPVQGDLPGILPAFNYQGCYLELEEKAAEVNALHEEYLERKEEAADAKKAWDRAAELYTKMALEFRRRRQAKGDDGPSVADPPARALACTWDKANPDDRCPLCSASSVADRDAVVRVLGAEILPREANGHADQVLTYRQKQDILATAVVLDSVVYEIPAETIESWSTEEREAVNAWAARQATAGHGVTIGVGERPAVLGTPHVAAEITFDAKVQACTVCGAVLKQLDSIKEAYPTGALVRTDCPGSETDGHRYPDTSKPKRQRKPRASGETDPNQEQVAQDPLGIQPASRARTKNSPKHKSFPKPSAKKSGKGRR